MATNRMHAKARHIIHMTLLLSLIKTGSVSKLTQVKSRYFKNDILF